MRSPGRSIRHRPLYTIARAGTRPSATRPTAQGAVRRTTAPAGRQPVAPADRSPAEAGYPIGAWTVPTLRRRALQTPVQLLPVQLLPERPRRWSRSTALTY